MPHGVQLDRTQDRRPEDNRQLIRAWAEPILHVPAPRPEHVVGGAEQLPVEADLGQGIEPVEDEGDALLGGKRGLNDEVAAILPVALGHPHDPQLLVADKRIGYAAGCHQICVDAARHCAGKPLFRGALAQLPGPIE